MTTSECADLWQMMGAYWPNSPRLTDRLTQRAYWLALAPYRKDECAKAIVRHSRRKGSYFPDVADITAGLTPVDADADTEETPVNSWDRPWTVYDAAELIGLWARLHGMEPPVCETVEEYFAWRRKALEAQREASA